MSAADGGPEDGRLSDLLHPEQLGRASYERFLATLPAPQPDRLAPVLVELTTIPLSTTDTGEILQRAASLCQRAYAHPVAVSVTLGPPVAPELVATNSKLAQQVDGAQVVAGEGPCQDAWGSGEPVATAALREDPRWPRLVDHLGATPVVAVTASPLRLGDTVAGCLNVYGTDPAVADEPALSTTALLASAITAVLHEAEARSDLERLVEQLRAAMASRSTIEQAKGILMARHRCGPDEAFRRLVASSSTTNVKLREVAARLVEEAAGG
jgi:GAF domain-containing protein